MLATRRQSSIGTDVLIRNLYRMAVFAKVAEVGSFSKAALALGLGKSVVSQHVATLEQSLGVALINRTPRSFSLTEDGHRFFESCVQMLAQADAGMQSLADKRTEACGMIRLSTAYDLGMEFLIPHLAAFSERHPKIAFDLVLDDNIINMVEKGIDLSIRVGWLRETRLYAVKLGSFSMVCCASPSFIERYGEPRSIDDIERARWVSITALPYPDRLSVQHRTGKRVTVPVLPVFRTNTGLAARELVSSGDMMALLPNYAVRDEFRTGRLVHVLNDWSVPDGTISAVFQHKSNMAPRLRLLLDFLRERFRSYGEPIEREAAE